MVVYIVFILHHTISLLQTFEKPKTCSDSESQVFNVVSDFKLNSIISGSEGTFFKLFRFTKTDNK